MKIRLKYNKKGVIKYISHLDTMRMFHRTFRRKGIPVSFSQGFNPHMLISLANPLPLGVESEVEFLDFETDSEIDLNNLIEELNSALPSGMEILSAEYTDSISINEIIKWSEYEFNFLNENGLSRDEVESAIEEILNSEEIEIEKRMKRSGRKVMGTVDVRAFIKTIELVDFFEKEFIVIAMLGLGNERTLNPVDFSKIFNRFSNVCEDVNSVNILRKNQYAEQDDRLVSMK